MHSVSSYNGVKSHYQSHLILIPSSWNPSPGTWQNNNDDDEDDNDDDDISYNACCNSTMRLGILILIWPTP